MTLTDSTCPGACYWLAWTRRLRQRGCAARNIASGISLASICNQLSDELRDIGRQKPSRIPGNDSPAPDWGTSVNDRSDSERPVLRAHVRWNYGDAVTFRRQRH
jgi:hypothetical protein